MFGGIDPRVRDRIVAETRGVPLAILEVPRTVSATELAGGFWISGKRNSTAAIEKASCSASKPSRRDANAAARCGGEPVGDAALFLSAAARLGIPIDALAPARPQG